MRAITLLAIAAVLLTGSSSAMGVPTIPQAISDNLSIRTSLDDLFEGFFRHLQDATSSPVGKLKAIEQDYNDGRERLRALYEAQRLVVVANSLILSASVRDWCFGKLDESYSDWLRQLMQRYESEKSSLYSELQRCQF